MNFDATVFGVVGQAAGDDAAVDAAFAKLYPALSSLMTYQGLVGGKPRQTCTLITVAEDGQFKMGLRDRDRDVSLWVSGATMTDAYSALEGALKERPVAWRRPTKDWAGKTAQNRKA